MPPKAGASDEQQYLWRVTITSVVLLMVLAMGIHASWTSGRLPFFEGEGYVSQADFKQMKDDARLSRENTLRTLIQSTWKEHCRARPGEYKEMLQDQLTNAQIEWQKLNPGLPTFPLPSSCSGVQE